MSDKYKLKKGERDPGFDEYIQQNTVDFTVIPPPPQSALTIEGIPLFTLGNVSMIVGKGKSKKTFFTAAATAATLGSETTLGKFTGTLPEDKKGVLFIDTEQSEYHAAKTGNRIYRLNNEVDLPNFKMIRMRRLDTKKRKEYIENIIEDTPGLGIVIIDGIRDLLFDINSPEEASVIKDWLLDLTDTYNIHIMVILHTNKGDKNPRGHIGTELINKCETTILIERDQKDKDISVVFFEYTRDKAPDDFAFYIDGEGLPSGCNIPPKQRSDTKIKPHEMAESGHIEIINEIWENETSFNATDLKEEIQLAVNKREWDIGMNLAGLFMKHWKKQKWIKGTKSGYKTLYIKEI